MSNYIYDRQKAILIYLTLDPHQISNYRSILETYLQDIHSFIIEVIFMSIDGKNLFLCERNDVKQSKQYLPY